jgi:hypothetical protein
MFECSIDLRQALFVMLSQASGAICQREIALRFQLRSIPTICAPT